MASDLDAPGYTVFFVIDNGMHGPQRASLYMPYATISAAAEAEVRATYRQPEYMANGRLAEILVAGITPGRIEVSDNVSPYADDPDRSPQVPPFPHYLPKMTMAEWKVYCEEKARGEVPMTPAPPKGFLGRVLGR